MVCYKRRNCPSRARNPGRPSSHSTGANSIRRHIRCSMCNSDPGDISITVWLLSKLSCRVRAWTPLALALKWAAAPRSRHLTVLCCFIPYYTLSPFFFCHPSCCVFSSLTGHWKKARAITLPSLRERRRIYPDSWCEMNSPTWSHNAQYRRSLGMEGDAVWRAFVCTHGHQPTHTDTSTQQCCTGAAVVWFIADEYLPAGHAMSKTVLAHGGKQRCWTTSGWKL